MSSRSDCCSWGNCKSSDTTIIYRGKPLCEQHQKAFFDLLDTDKKKALRKIGLPEDTIKFVDKRPKTIIPPVAEVVEFVKVRWV